MTKKSNPANADPQRGAPRLKARRWAAGRRPPSDRAARRAIQRQRAPIRVEPRAIFARPSNKQRDERFLWAVPTSTSEQVGAKRRPDARGRWSARFRESLVGRWRPAREAGDCSSLTKNDPSTQRRRRRNHEGHLQGRQRLGVTAGGRTARHPPHGGAHPRAGGQAPVPAGALRLRPGDGEGLLLRRRSGRREALGRGFPQD